MWARAGFLWEFSFIAFSLIDFPGREEHSTRICWGRLTVANIEPGLAYPVTIDVRVAGRVQYRGRVVLTLMGWSISTILNDPEVILKLSASSFSITHS